MKITTTKKFELSIRTKPETRDIEAVRSMVNQTGFFRPDETDIAVELVGERLKKDMESGYHFFLAEIHNELAGYTCFGQIPCSLLSWDLYWIVTKNELQGLGIGAALLNLTEEEIKKEGGKNVVIETSSKTLYQSTQQFYLKNGYDLKARFTDFYDYGDDKLVYVKMLA